jgi:hypothetical protein
MAEGSDSGKREAEGGSASLSARVNPDAPSVAVNDLLTDRQADSGARVLRAMQAFEYAKDESSVFRGDADPIVMNGNPPITAIGIGADSDDRGRFGAIFKRVTYEVLEELDQMDLAD